MWNDILNMFSSNPWAIFWMAFIAYFLGDINFSIIVSKITADKDIREYGSGNAGATNVLRNFGKKAAIITALGDLGKSIAAVLIGQYILVHFCDCSASQESIKLFAGYISGLCCVLGHLFPALFCFRGGKGVLATLGMSLVLDFRIALIGLAVFAVIVGISKYVSLASMSAGVVMVAMTYVLRVFFDHSSLQTASFATLILGLIVFIIILKHGSNIKRLVAGTESKISWRKAKD